MQQLVYISKAAITFDEAALHALCRQAADHNRAARVTGLLVYDGARFIQALEGEEAAVREIMARIRQDPRHNEIDVLADKSIADRQFGDWSMDTKSALEAWSSREFLQKVKEDVSTVDDPKLRAAFIGFAVLGTSNFPDHRWIAG